MNKTFDSDFYVTTSTIIPVLYIALAAQFPLLSRLVSKYPTFYLAARNRNSRGPKIDNRTQMQLNILIVVSGVIAWVAVIFLALSALGEVLSLLALYRESDDPSVKQTVFESTVVLIILTLAVPTWYVMTILINFFFPGLMPKAVKSGTVKEIMLSFGSMKPSADSIRSRPPLPPRYRQVSANAAYLRRIQRQTKGETAHNKANRARRTHL